MKSGAAFLSLVSIVLALVVATPTSAQIFADVLGAAQGPIEGDSTTPGEEDSIEIGTFRSSIKDTYDPATGQPTGRRQHSPILITKDQDPASLSLLHAFFTNERLDVQFRMWRPDFQTGASEHFYTIELMNARIVEVEQVADSQAFVPIDALLLVYQNIRWIDELTGQEVSESWLAGSTNVDLSRSTTKLLPLPNPTQDSTVLRFDLPEAVDAELVVYDLRGREVRRLHDGITPVQRMAIRWDGTDDMGSRVARGMYLVKLRWPEGEITERVTLLR